MLTPFAKKDVIDWREFLESESEKKPRRMLTFYLAVGAALVPGRLG